MRLPGKNSSVRLIISRTEDLILVHPSSQATVVTLEQAKTAGDTENYVDAWLEDNGNLCLPPDVP